ncbi:MAG: SDR family oxidoreductase [Chloroflexi bacterium]|nr:SDR family oxidoreductase [Chloroflexota bacterium]MBL6961296.1 SDR family oxidoreductase [Anaerolineales bacterium]
MVLENRVVVITGATGGLGRVVAHSMAKQGARLALLGRSTERLEQLASEIGLTEDHYLAQEVNLSNAEAVEAVAQAVAGKFGKMDVLLNLVGGWTGGKSVVEANPDDVSTMLQQHVWTTFFMAQAFVPHLVDNEWGRVIIVSSPFAASPRAKGAPYAMGKAAQEALMLTLAQELKGTGVTSNVLLVKTIDVKHVRENDSSAKNAFWTTPEEIANAILYLCSDEAKMVNGARLPLYGSP